MLVDNLFSSQALYRLTDVEPIEIRWKKQALVFIFKLLHGLLPQFVCDRISLKEDSYNLRNSQRIIKLSKPKTNFLKCGCLYSSAQLFNNLPENVRINNNLKAFEGALDAVVT